MPKLYLKNETLVQSSNSNENLKPRQHIIDTLLNYSKSLEINTMKNGKKVALILN